MADAYEALGELDQMRRLDQMFEGRPCMGALLRGVGVKIDRMEQGLVLKSADELAVLERNLTDCVSGDAIRAQIPVWRLRGYFAFIHRAYILLARVYDMIGTEESRIKAQEARHKAEELKEEDDHLFQVSS